MLTRRATIAALAGLFVPGEIRAQSFPNRPVTIVVPYPAGGPVDLTARLIAQSIGTSLGQPIAVDNRGGGAGVIGSVMVQHAEPDGHTLILGTNQTHATNQSLLKNCPYDAVKDFTGVAGIAEIPHVLVVRRGLEAQNIGALVQLAKKSPGELNYASTGVGSAAHLAAELFKIRAGVDFVAVGLMQAIAGRVAEIGCALQAERTLGDHPGVAGPLRHADHFIRRICLAHDVAGCRLVRGPGDNDVCVGLNLEQRHGETP